MGDATYLAKVRKILDYLDWAHRESIRTARLDVLHLFNFSGNTLNPLKALFKVLPGNRGIAG